LPLACVAPQEAYKKRLAENLLSSENAKEAKILAFKTKVGRHTAGSGTGDVREAVAGSSWPAPVGTVSPTG
jgi:hypothetical protein